MEADGTVYYDRERDCSAARYVMKKVRWVKPPDIADPS